MGRCCDVELTSGSAECTRCSSVDRQMHIVRGAEEGRKSSGRKHGVPAAAATRAVPAAKLLLMRAPKLSRNWSPPSCSQQ